MYLTFYIVSAIIGGEFWAVQIIGTPFPMLHYCITFAEFFNLHLVRYKHNEQAEEDDVFSWTSMQTKKKKHSTIKARM